ncbi:MAG: IctB family putative bicarbonate transporter [Cyanobacteria bacterium J06641_5]
MDTSTTNDRLVPTQSLRRWRGASFFYHAVGLLHPWKEGSLLLRWAEPLGALLMACVLGLGPFVSTGLIGVLLLACGGFWLVLTLADKGDRGGITTTHLWILLYWGVAIVAVAFSPVQSAAFSGWVKLTLYLLWFALSARILRGRRWQNWTIALYLLVSLVVSIYGVRQEMFGAEQLATWNDPLSTQADDTRAYSYLGNPNLLAGYLIPAVALSGAACFAWRSWLQKAAALVLLLANTACLFFTDSRGGWIGAAAMGLTFALLLYFWWRPHMPKFWRVWFLPLAIGTGVIFLAGAIAAVEPLRLRLASIFAWRGDSSNNFRINVWYAAIDMIRARPVLGIGPGNAAFNKIYPLFMRPNYSALSAYSIYLEVAVETGLVGLAAFLALLNSLGQHGWQGMIQLRSAEDKSGFWLIAAIAAMVGMLAHGLVDTVWYRPQINVVWWFLAALAVSQAGDTTQSRSS